jgi:hypothetical protein
MSARCRSDLVTGVSAPARMPETTMLSASAGCRMILVWSAAGTVAVRKPGRLTMSACAPSGRSSEKRPSAPLRAEPPSPSERGWRAAPGEGRAAIEAPSTGWPVGVRMMPRRIAARTTTDAFNVSAFPYAGSNRIRF